MENENKPAGEVSEDIIQKAIAAFLNERSEVHRLGFRVADDEVKLCALGIERGIRKAFEVIKGDADAEIAALKSALRELVYLKSEKDWIDGQSPVDHETQDQSDEWEGRRADYYKRKPLAWIVARELLEPKS